jgi:uncharacterized protein (DUF2236 family)
LVEIHAMPDADRTILLTLHDDVGIVTDMALEKQLELVSASVVSPLAGIFGPKSMTWQINREAIIFLAAGRALLLQLAHPWRRDFGFGYGDAERRSAERALEVIRRTYPLLPARLRYVAPYHEARERVGGKSPPKIRTQLLNRLWIGQRYIAD